MSHSDSFLNFVSEVADKLDRGQVDAIVRELVSLRERGGRLFLLGVGGSAANCSHAVNDFRKLCGIEAYSPVDNVSELTARTNDEGWATVFSTWLRVSKLKAEDALFILSVGGGDLRKNISPNLVEAIKEAKRCGARVLGIVGRDGGYTAEAGDAVVVIPVVDPALVTPLSEAFQAVIWHSMVCHPLLAVQAAKWESAEGGK